MRNIEFENIEVENFRSIENMGFKYKPNRFCVIVGKNGTGKTSLIADAICWALYDETSKGRKGDSVIRKREGKNTFVKLTFTIDDISYTIENYRKHSEFGDEKFLKRNGIDISGSKRAITNQKIEQLFVSKDVFMNCILFSQYISKSFTELTDKGQKTIFDQMMGFSRYDEYQETTKSIIKKCINDIEITNDNIVSIDDNINRNQYYIINEKEIYKNTVEEYRKQINDIQNTMKWLLSENVELKNSVIDFDDLIAKKKLLYDNITKIENRKETLTEKFNRELKDTEEVFKNEYEKLKHEFEISFKDNVSKLIEEKNKVELEVGDIRSKVEKRKSEIETEYLKKSNDNSNNFNTIISNIREAVNEIKNGMSTCKNEVENIEKLKLSKTIEISDIKSKLEGPTPRCFACNQLIKDKGLKQILERSNNLSTEFNDLEKQEVSLKNNYNKLLKKINPFTEKEDTARIEFDRVCKDLLDWKNSELSILKMSWNKEKARIDKRRAEIDPRIEDKKTKFTEKLDKIKSELKVNCDIGKSAITDMHKNDIIKLKELYQNTKVEFENINKDIELKQGNRDKISRNEATIISKKDELDKLIKTSKKIVEMIHSKIVELEQSLNKNSEDLQEKKDLKILLEKRKRILDFWNMGFSSKGIRAILLDDAIPILNRFALELSREIDCIRVRFDSTRNLKSGDIRNEFSVQPIQTRNLTDDRMDFSEGEGRMVDIITLLSLRHLLETTYDIRFNISLFDEILDSLDSYNSEVVVNFLKKMSETSCTILITHTLKNKMEYDELLEF